MRSGGALERAPLLRGERPHEWRERLEVAQDLGDGIERPLEAWMAYGPLQRMIAPGGAWHIHRQMLQTVHDLPQRKGHFDQNGPFLVERREVVVGATQPGWPIARREPIQPRQERV